MGFFKLLHHHRLFIHYLTVVIVIFGIFSLFRIQREARPNVNFNRVAITAAYPGASPSDIEELVVAPIEEKVAEVDGVKQYRSVSFSGAGSVAVEIDDTYPNVDEIIDEIRRKVGEVKNLPEGVRDPAVTEIKAVNIPILSVAVYGDLEPLLMKREIEKLRDYLKSFKGVQTVSYSGMSDLQIKILSAPEKLDAYDLTLLEMINALGGRSKQKPGGFFENKKEAANITIGEDYDSLEKLKGFVVRSNDAGARVTLDDVASIAYGSESIQSISTFAGKNATLVTVVKKPSADIVKTVERIKKSLKEYEKRLPHGLSYKLYTDESLRVRTQLKTVAMNALFGLVLVLIILVIYLDFRSALVTSIGIPIAILGGIAVLYSLGSTMNTLVLVGMIVVLGMLVDDAIVVCENIFSKLEAGLSPEKAAIEGTSEIAIPVIATILTTMLAFFPILLMQGIMGQFISVIPLTVICMLAVSLFEALVILPIHAGEIMRTRPKRRSLFSKFEEAYRRYLEWMLHRRWLAVVAIIFIFGASGYAGKALLAKFSLFPAKSLTGLTIRMEVLRNTPIAKTAKLTNILSERLEKISGNDFDSIYANVGQVRTGGASGSRQNGSHLAQISVVFTSDPTFIDREKALVSAIRAKTREFAEEFNAKASVAISRPGPPVGRPLQYQVTSRSFEESKKIVGELTSSMKEIDGVHGIVNDAEGDTRHYRVIIDNDLAVSEGVNPADISRTIFAAATGIVTSEILKDNNKVEILVGLLKKDADSIEQLSRLRVRNKTGQAVPIAVFTKTVVEKGASSIQRLDGIRTITLFGDVDEKIISGAQANKRMAKSLKKIKEKYKTAKIETGGGEKDRINVLKDTMRLYLLAIILIFMVISLTFQSVIYPFFVLLVVPFGLCGVVWSLTLHDTPLSLMGLVGVVGLSGVVVNISIIMLSFVQKETQNGVAFKEAIIRAGVRRLRPIIITTVTTLIGLVPSIYGFGGVDAFVQPISLVLGWGLFVATLITLFLLPSLIALFPVLAKRP